jgi:threonine dehydrogenase-like Zn-dependent dehydrogenase
MLAARYLGPNRLEPVEVPAPSIETGDALVRIKACGFCGSDIGIVSGVHPRARAPLTIGHECSGIVAEIAAPGTDLAPGDSVVVFPLITCGQCNACRTGFSHVCSRLRLYGFDAEGGMAEFLRVPSASLLKLPRDMPHEIGALIEPLAVAVHGLNRASWTEGALAVVIGAGPIGLLTALVARARGIRRVLISDVLDSRLALARDIGLEALPARSLKASVDDLTNGEGVELVLECAGTAATARTMTDLARPRATVVNVSVFKKPAEVDLQAINFKELTLAGTRVYERRDFETAIALAKDLPLQKLISNSFPLQQVSEAYARFAAGEGCKFLIRPGG